MRNWLLILLFTCVCCSVQAQMNIITTVAGNDVISGFSGDLGLATNAKLYAPEGLCLDKSGNIYIADAGNNRIRKVTLSTGIITTIAGSEILGFSGDGGPATNAQLFAPEDVVVDSVGNVFLADAGNNRIRKIAASTGIITTIAGSGPTAVVSAGDNGDGGPATDALIGSPSGICLDQYGNIYIADYGNNKVRKVDAATGIITTVAGKSTIGYAGGYIDYSGDGGQATDAQFSGPNQLYADNDGNIFISDQWNHVVREITGSTGIITTVAGKGIMGYSGDGGPAINARLNQPCGIYVDALDNIFITEYDNGTIRRVDGVTGIITTVAGKGVREFSGDNGPATNAELRCGDAWVDKYGTLFIADMDNNRIRMVYDTALHVGIKEVSKSEVKIYPNPTGDELTIEGADGSAVSIFNTIGMKVYSEESSFDKLRMTNNKAIINTRSLVPGMYIIQIVGSSGDKEVRRFVKE